MKYVPSGSAGPAGRHRRAQHAHPPVHESRRHRHQVGPERVAAAHHVLEERSAQHVADVNVAHLQRCADRRTPGGAVGAGRHLVDRRRRKGPSHPVRAEARRPRAPRRPPPRAPRTGAARPRSAPPPPAPPPGGQPPPEMEERERHAEVHAPRPSSTTRRRPAHRPRRCGNARRRTAPGKSGGGRQAQRDGSDAPDAPVVWSCPGTCAGTGRGGPRPPRPARWPGTGRCGARTWSGPMLTPSTRSSSAAR
jgi:hypothetical protein